MNSHQRKKHRKSAELWLHNKLVPLLKEMADAIEKGEEDPKELAQDLRNMISDFENVKELKKRGYDNGGIN